MDQQETLVKLEEVGALVTNSHVVYKSGKHGSAYVNIARALNHIDLALWFGEQMAVLVESLGFDTIVAPTHSDDKLGPMVAAGLSRLGKPVHPVYAQEKTEVVRALVDGEERELEVVTNELFLPREQEEFVRDKKVVVVGDVLTTGGTSDKVSKLVRETGGFIVAVLVACNRGSFSKEFHGYPLYALMNIPLEAWDPPCKLCEANIPINTKVGHGQKYLEILRK